MHPNVKQKTLALVSAVMFVRDADPFLFYSSPSHLQLTGSIKESKCMKKFWMPNNQYYLINLHATPSNTLPIYDPRIEPRSIYKLVVQLPLGLTLEEMDISDPSYGVVIIGINPDGNVARLNSHVFTHISQYDSFTIGKQCICIRDKIISVNGSPCHDKSLDHVMQLIINSESNEVTIEIGRIQPSTVLHYSHGVCIAAKSGESYGFLAQKCGVEVMYECRTGNCLTCSRWMEFPDKINSGKENERNVYRRTILNCVGTVPRNYDWLNIFDDDRSDAMDENSTASS